MRHLTPVLTLASALLLGAGALSADDKADLTGFRDYLKQNHPDKKWQTGPERLDSPELRKAYENRRFYYVFSAPPLPGGAFQPVDKIQRQLEEFRKQFVSVTIRMDDKERITPLQKADDYNAELMPVKTDDDAKVAAAAILSLHGQDRVGPGIISADQVKVTNGDKGWQCSVSKKNAFESSVTFNTKGKCTAVSKIYSGPLPP